MKNTQTIVIAVVFVVVLIGAYFLIVNKPGPYDNYAKCISNKGLIMYGAFWCPHCQEQKAMFSTSFKYINYVECSTPDGSAQTPACINANITAYPTWQFPNGSREVGVLSFDQLNQITSCSNTS